jgi:hypothetical protein
MLTKLAKTKIASPSDRSVKQMIRKPIPSAALIESVGSTPARTPQEAAAKASIPANAQRGQSIWSAIGQPDCELNIERLL